MKVFIRNCSAYLCIMALVLFVISRIFDYRNQDDVDGTFKFRSVPSNIQIENMGSSHGKYSFSYEGISDENCFNFGLSSQTLSYDYNILNEYISHMDDNSILFIVVSYFSFYKDEETESDFHSKNLRYYEILSPQNIKDYSIFDDYIYDWFSVMAPSKRHISTIANAFLGIKPQRSNDELNKEIVEGSVSGWQANVGTINEKEVSAVYDIIELCRENNITPILITTPYLSEYTDRATQDFLDDWYGIINKIQSDCGVLYWDYSKDATFSSSYEYFMDYFHLNEEGAKVFTKMVLDRVVKEEIR